MSTTHDVDGNNANNSANHVEADSPASNANNNTDVDADNAANNLNNSNEPSQPTAGEVDATQSAEVPSITNEPTLTDTIVNSIPGTTMAHQVSITSARRTRIVAFLLAYGVLCFAVVYALAWVVTTLAEAAFGPWGPTYVVVAAFCLIFRKDFAREVWWYVSASVFATTTAWLMYDLKFMPGLAVCSVLAGICASLALKAHLRAREQSASK